MYIQTVQKNQRNLSFILIMDWRPKDYVYDKRYVMARQLNVSHLSRNTQCSTVNNIIHANSKIYS